MESGRTPFRTRAKRALLSAPIPFRRLLLNLGWRTYEWWVTRRGRRSHADVPPALAGRWPVPPVELRVLVSCDSDPKLFLESGREQVAFFVALLERNGIAADGLGSVLDFGCGCGRLARWWPQGGGPALHGCDYNPKLVKWCRRNLGSMEARVSALYPPLPYADDSFDLVYALSVFTHLPEPLQGAWVDELARVLHPGAMLLFTVSGEAYTDHLSPPEREAFERGELVTHFDEVAGTNLCAAYHPRRYVEDRLLHGFEILEAVEPGRDPRGSPPSLVQDTYLCRRR